MKKTNAVYKIFNKITGDFYVGSAKGFKAHRWSNHQNKMKNENHNKKINVLIKLYGFNKDDWDYEVLEHVHDYELEDREEYWTKLLNPTLNVKDSTKRPKISYYKRKQTNEKISKAMSGSNNPMWKGLLLDDDVLRIRLLFAIGLTNKEIYELYKNKISKSMLSEIKNYKKYKHIKLEDYVISDYTATLEVV